MTNKSYSPFSESMSLHQSIAGGEVEQPIATYQGSSYWGARFGTLHYFTLQQDYPARQLVKGSSVTSKMVIELGGEIISLDKLKKGDNIFTK